MDHRVDQGVDQRGAITLIQTPRQRPERESDAAASPLSALFDLVAIVKQKRPEWTEVQRASWLKANLPAIADVVAQEAVRGDPEAAIRVKVRRFARVERETPASTAAAEYSNGGEHPTRALVRRRLAMNSGIREPTEAQIRAHFDDFKHLGPYIPPDCGENGAGTAP